MPRTKVRMALSFKRTSICASQHPPIFKIKLALRFIIAACQLDKPPSDLTVTPLTNPNTHARAHTHPNLQTTSHEHPPNNTRKTLAKTEAPVLCFVLSFIVLFRLFGKIIARTKTYCRPKKTITKCICCFSFRSTPNSRYHCSIIIHHTMFSSQKDFAN